MDGVRSRTAVDLVQTVIGTIDIENIVASTANQCVVALVTYDAVVTVAGVYHVITGGARDGVITSPGVDLGDIDKRHVGEVQGVVAIGGANDIGSPISRNTIHGLYTHPVG